MNKLNSRWGIVLAWVGWLMCPQTSFGLGLGSPVTHAVLGDALSVSVPVRLDSGEQISDECVKAEVWFGEDKVPGAAVRAHVHDPRAGAFQSGSPVLKVSTSMLVNEPAVTVVLAVGCPARMTRRFVALADPPRLSPAVMTSQRVAEDAKPAATESAAAPEIKRVDSVQDPVSKRTLLGKAASSFKVAAGVSADAAGKTPASPKTAARPKLVQRVASVPRLELDPANVDAQLNPRLILSGGLSVDPSQDASPEVAQRRKEAAALWSAMNTTPEEQARDRLRLAEVEQRLANLAKDGERANQALRNLEGQLQSVSPSVAYWSTLVVAIICLLAFVIWRERRVRQLELWHQQWLASQMAMDADTRTEIDTDAFDSEEAETPSSSGHDVKSGVLPTGALPHQVDVFLPTAPGALAPCPPDMGEVKQKSSDYWRDVSIDELIDLDQQVEFFMVLGQEESAIEVLENHIHVSGGWTPLPFLKLLDIYRSMGLRADYERTRMNFNLRFNAHAPLWDADAAEGHELSDYPGVLERIQALWPQPTRALHVLEQSLLRQDPESYRFDLPAYKELVLLYRVLRDRLAHGDFVPVGSPTSPAVMQADIQVELAEDAHPLMATLPMKALPELAPVLGLDLELGDDGLIVSGAVSQRLPAQSS